MEEEEEAQRPQQRRRRPPSPSSRPPPPLSSPPLVLDPTQDVDDLLEPTPPHARVQGAGATVQRLRYPVLSEDDDSDDDGEHAAADLHVNEVLGTLDEGDESDVTIESAVGTLTPVSGFTSGTLTPVELSPVTLDENGNLVTPMQHETHSRLPNQAQLAERLAQVSQSVNQQRTEREEERRRSIQTPQTHNSRGDDRAAVVVGSGGDDDDDDDESGWQSNPLLRSPLTPSPPGSPAGAGSGTMRLRSLNFNPAFSPEHQPLAQPGHEQNVP